MENIRARDEFKGFAKKAGIVFDDDQDEIRFLDVVTEELEMRIGESISFHCKQKEIDEFETLTDIKEKEKWLEKYVPQYKIIVRKHTIKIKSEIRDFKDYIIAEKNRMNHKEEHSN